MRVFFKSQRPDGAVFDNCLICGKDGPVNLLGYCEYCWINEKDFKNTNSSNETEQVLAAKRILNKLPQNDKMVELLQDLYPHICAYENGARGSKVGLSDRINKILEE